MALSLKNKLFDYFAQRHFDLMSPEVRARFDDYAKNKDFQGHMKYWDDNYKGAMLPDFFAPGAYQLTNAEWEELYDAFQETFQAMDYTNTPSVGFESPYKTATKDFIAKYFGDSSKTFTTTTATGETNTAFHNLEVWLSANRPSLTVPFKQNLADVFTDGYTYDKLISDLGSKKYDSDFSLRKKLARIVEYIEYYQTYPDPSYLPAGIPNVDLSMLATDDKDRYSIKNKNYHINQFKGDFSEIFDTLLKKTAVRADVIAQAPDTISKPLSKAIESTDYENKDSKDFVPEKYPDDKNWHQRFEDFKNDTYENHFRRFVNPSRGTRLFFSPWSQNIIKAFDKVKIKPTDGLGAILSKKNDILDKLKSSKTSADHFEWFAQTIETLQSAGMGKAVEGALRNGKQMRHLVSGLIAEAVKKGKEKEAKTALEILSVAKYGLSSSRTLNALNDATKDMSILSDKNLSWNKNEGIQFVTKAMDKTAGLAIRGVGLAATGIHNFIQHRRTKIGSDISDNKILNDAHKQWESENATNLAKLHDSNIRLNVRMKLSTLASGNGLSGTVIANETDLEAAETMLAGMAPGPAYDDLKADIDLYKDAKTRQDKEDNWANNHKDKYQELIAYWDMLESVGKTHAFTLGSMDLKRKAMLKDWANNTSKAQTQANAYLASFDNLRTS